MDRFGYFAYELRKKAVNRFEVEHIGFAEVNHELGHHDRFIERLQPWAEALLRDGRHEAGLYSFCYAEINGYEESGEAMRDLMLAWDGTEAAVFDPPVPTGNGTT